MSRAQGKRDARGARAGVVVARRGWSVVFPHYILSRLLAGLLLIVFGAGPVSAERWRIQPTASLETEYDDNVRLTAIDAQSAFSGSLAAALRGIRSSEVSDVEFSVGLAGTSYSGLSELDNNSGYVGLDLGYRLERNQFRLGARLDSESTLTSEVATTGLNQVNKQRNRLTLDGGWAYLLTDRATLDLGASYQDVSYEDVELLPLFNYRLGAVSLANQYRLTERLGLIGRLSYERYETQDTPFTNEYGNAGAQVGADYQLSETTSLSAQLGFRRTEQTLDGLDNLRVTRESSGQTYLVGFSKRFEVGGTLKLEARRDLAPSGGGELLDTTGLRANLSLRMAPRWLFALGANAYRNRSPYDDRSEGRLTYADLTPRLAYELDESWRLSLGYRLRWQERDGGLDDAVSNAVFLTLNWTRPWDM